GRVRRKAARDILDQHVPDRHRPDALVAVDRARLEVEAVQHLRRGDDELHRRALTVDLFARERRRPHQRHRRDRCEFPGHSTLPCYDDRTMRGVMKIISSSCEVLMLCVLNKFPSTGIWCRNGMRVWALFSLV